MRRWLINVGVLLLFPAVAEAGQIPAAQSCLLGAGFVPCIDRTDFSKEPEQAAWLTKCRTRPAGEREQCYLDTLDQFGYAFASPEQVKEQAAREQARRQALERESEQARKDFEERNRRRAEELRQLEGQSGRSFVGSVEGPVVSSKVITPETVAPQGANNSPSANSPPSNSQALAGEDPDPRHDEAYCLFMEAEKVLLERSKTAKRVEYEVGFSYVIRNGCRKTFRSISLRADGRNWNEQSVINREFFLTLGPFQEEKGRLTFFKYMTQSDFDAVKTVTVRPQ